MREYLFTKWTYEREKQLTKEQKLKLDDEAKVCVYCLNCLGSPRAANASCGSTWHPTKGQPQGSSEDSRLCNRFNGGIQLRGRLGFGGHGPDETT